MHRSRSTSKRAPAEESHGSHRSDPLVYSQFRSAALENIFYLNDDRKLLIQLRKLSKKYNLKPDFYWRLLRHAWLKSTSVTKNQKIWTDLFSQKIEGRESFMAPEERLEFKLLPESLEVFRGCHEFSTNSFSWSLNQDIAANYPPLKMRRTARPRILLKGQILKTDIIAFINARGEREIIAPPGKVEIVRKEVTPGNMPYSSLPSFT